MGKETSMGMVEKIVGFESRKEDLVRNESDSCLCCRMP